jgi:acetyl esterase/lipase
MKKVLCSFVISVLLFGACKEEAPLNKIVKADEILNLEYGSNPRNKMDVYFPDERLANSKVILFIHGDTWYKGEKSNYTDLAKFYRDRGYVTATMNYRLAAPGEADLHSARLDDLNKVVELISSKAQEWNILPNNIGIVGIDAGAYLGLLYSYTYDKKSRIKAVVSLAAPVNLADLHAKNSDAQALEGYFESSLKSSTTTPQQASPLFLINSSSAPTLIFHGKRDQVVPYKQALDFKLKLDEFKVKNKLIAYEETGHEVLTLNLMASFLGEVDSWFKANLK